MHKLVEICSLEVKISIPSSVIEGTQHDWLNKISKGNLQAKDRREARMECLPLEPGEERKFSSTMASLPNKEELNPL